jgi:hypothetical protein
VTHRAIELPFQRLARDVLTQRSASRARAVLAS